MVQRRELRSLGTKLWFGKFLIFFYWHMWHCKLNHLSKICLLLVSFFLLTEVQQKHHISKETWSCQLTLHIPNLRLSSPFFSFFLGILHLSFADYSQFFSLGLCISSFRFCDNSTAQLVSSLCMVIITGYSSR